MNMFSRKLCCKCEIHVKAKPTINNILVKLKFTAQIERGHILALVRAKIPQSRKIVCSLALFIIVANSTPRKEKERKRNQPNHSGDISESYHLLYTGIG